MDSTADHESHQLGPAASPGWYADPSSHAPIRYWDGTRWTGRTIGGRIDVPAPLLSELEPPSATVPFSLREVAGTWLRMNKGKLVAGASLAVAVAAYLATRGESRNEEAELSLAKRLLDEVSDEVRSRGDLELGSDVHILDPWRTNRLMNRRGRYESASPRVTRSQPQTGPLARPDGRFTGTKVA